MIDPKTIGRNIRAFRKSVGLNQKEFAIQIQINEDYLGTIERGERIPSVKMMVHIANFFGVGINDLINETSSIDATKIDWAKCVYNLLMDFDKEDYNYLHTLSLRVKSLKGC